MTPALRMLLLLLLAAFGTLPASATEMPPLWLTHMDLEVRLDYEQKVLQGTSRLTLRNAGNVPVNQIPLQIGRLMTAVAAFDDTGVSLPFEQDVVLFEDWPTYQVNQLFLTLPSAIAPGEEQTVGLRYAGALVGATESGMEYVRDHIDPDFTILRSESRAFPVVAVPSLAALRTAPRRDFTYDLRVTVPKDLTVAAGAQAVRTDSASGSTWSFRGHEPVPFLNVCIAPYRVLTSKNAVVHHFAADSLGARRLRSAIEACLDLYVRWFGPLEGEPVLRVMEIPEGWGSQASLTAGIMQTADAFRESRELVQLYHELAHLWHPRDLDVPAPRWNEGLAMFLQQRAAVTLDGAEDLDSFMQARAEKLRQQIRESETLRSVPMLDYGKHDMTGYSYRTGQLFFHVLHAVLGAEAFDRILGDYFRAFRSSGSTTQDFVTFVESRAAVPLQPLFEEWMMTTRWATRLEADEPLHQIIDSYRSH